MLKLSELKISPTPWKVDKDTNGWYIVRDAKGKYAATPDGDKETEAISNARLFVAAPELYDCLREAVIEMCHSHSCCGTEDECNGLDGRCFVQRWRKALAKAAGEDVANG